MEKNQIKLGIYEALRNSDATLNLEKHLNAVQYELEYHVYKARLKEITYREELKSKAIDILALPLNQLPTSLNKELAITALHGRLNARWILLLHKKHDSIMAFKTETDFEVFAPNPMISAQIKELFPNLSVETESSSNSLIKAFSDGTKNAIIIPYHEALHFNVKIEEYCHFIFEPSELVPCASEGVTAFITRVDAIETRKLLIPYHNKDLAYITNIERKISKALKASTTLVELGIHCFKNKQNHYELICCYRDQQSIIKKLYFTQITYVGLADKAISQLNLD